VTVVPAPIVSVIAVGNRYRSDDGVGAAVLARLANRFAGDSRVRLIEADGEPAGLMQSWEGSSYVWVIDAVSSGGLSGTLHEVDVQRLGAFDDRSTGIGGGHVLGVREAVDLARALGLLPTEMRVLGIEGASFDNGEGLTPAVADAVVQAADVVARGVCEALGAKE
jgi:hydrogenase maturation protease